MSYQVPLLRMCWAMLPLPCTLMIICLIQHVGTCMFCEIFLCYQVVLFAAQPVVNSRRWIIIKNNVPLVDRQQWQNAVPSDDEWVRHHCLYTLVFGTVVTSDWGRGKTAVLWAVAQCSLVDTDHDDRGAFYLHPLWRQMVSLTHWYCYTTLYSITHQKTVVSEEHHASQDA